MSDALLQHAVAKLEAVRANPIVPCKVCNGEASPFDILDFNKSCAANRYVLGFVAIPVVYRICARCQFIFTDFGDEFSSTEWATYVYNDQYIHVDPDYREVRPRHNAGEISALLAGRRRTIQGLDYGGGNGQTAALLRADGWVFDSYDPYGVREVSPERVGHYNFCSAIEVFEHTPDPVASLRELLAMTDPVTVLILLGTSTHDHHVSPCDTRLSWWYAAPRNGHISLFSRKALGLLAEQFNLTYVCGNGGTSHLMARGYSQRTLTALLPRSILLRRMQSALRLLLGRREGPW